MNARYPLVVGSILGGLGVALGAFGAHGLESALANSGLGAAEQARQLDTWEVAVRYQMYHALALLMIGVLGDRVGSPRATRLAVWLFVVGVGIFSGLLYVLVLSGVKILGAIVPIGGVALIAGWAALGYSLATGKK